MPNLYFDLLKTWCDRLVTLQLRDTGDPRFDGGLLCPACKLMHGRSDNAIYPMMLLADRTGDVRYLDAAKRLFEWQSNLLCDDGGLYNDPNSEWRGITVFSAIGLVEALSKYGHLLDAEIKARWEERLAHMGEWLYNNLDEHTPTNINYPVTNAAALELLGGYFHNDAYHIRARRLADYSMSHFTADGLLYGEGKPHDALTPRGCRPVDIGYNVEESVPALVRYALAANDTEMLEKLRVILLQQLDFLLPDGSWDNSFGSRNNKWTYWGSRTSDGCQSAYLSMRDAHPAFAEAALRNTRLMTDCTHDGLLHGGPHYHRHGEPPCVHHTFTHANALAVALDAADTDVTDTDGPRVDLPSDRPPALQYYKEIDTWKIAVGKWRATVTGYDYTLSAGHATGGTLTMLWHEKSGPVVASSVLDYRLVEPHNMQLPLRRGTHRPLTPRVECLTVGERFAPGERFAQAYDTQAEIQAVESTGKVTVSVHSSLVNMAQEPLTTPVNCRLDYRFTQDSVTISGRLEGETLADACFILPLITKDAIVSSSTIAPDPEAIFFLTGGFEALEYRILPDRNGEFQVSIAIHE